MKGLSHYGSPFVARQEGLCPGAARAYRLAALVAPSAKTVHRTVFFVASLLPPCSSPSRS